MTAKTSAGTTLQVSASAPATHDAAGFAALVYTPVGEIVDIGEFGREYNLVTHNPLGNRSTQKMKGSFNEGGMSMQLALDTDDAGQVLMKAAKDSDNAYSFKVTSTVGGGAGDVYYFRALVMNWKVGIGGVDQVTAATTQMEIISNVQGTAGVVEVLA